MPSVSLTNPGTQNNYDGDVVSVALPFTDTGSSPYVNTTSNVPSGLNAAISGSNVVISGSLSSWAHTTSPYSVTIGISDMSNLMDYASQTFTWNVSQPTVSLTNPGNQTNYDGDVVSLGLSASEDAGHSLSYSVSSGSLPSGLSLNSSTGVISGTISSGADSFGPYSPTLTATDSPAGVSASKTITWTVRPPYLDVVQGNQEDAAGEAVTVDLQSVYVPGHSVSYSASGLPSGLSINSATGEVSGTIASTAHAGSPYSVTVSASDSAGGASASTSFSWTVDTPSVTVLSIGDLGDAVGASIDFPTVATDSDGGAMTYTASGLPNGLGISSTTGVVTGTIASGADAGSPYSVTITATDGNGTTSASASFAWKVYDLVLKSPGDQKSLDGNTVSLTPDSSYANSGTLTFSASGLPSGLSISSSTGTISGTISSSADAGSPYSVTLGVTDGTISASTAFTWRVKDILLQNPGPQTNNDGDSVSVPVTVSKISGHTVTYSATGLPSGLSISSSTGVISGTVADNADASSPYSVAVTATDTTASVSVTKSMTWTVDLRNAPPPPADPNPWVPPAMTPGEAGGGDAGRITWLRRARAAAYQARGQLEQFMSASGELINTVYVPTMVGIMVLYPETYESNATYVDYKTRIENLLPLRAIVPVRIDQITAEITQMNQTLDALGAQDET